MRGVREWLKQAGDHTVAGDRKFPLYAVKPDTGENATAGDVEVLRAFGPYQDRSRL